MNLCDFVRLEIFALFLTAMRSWLEAALRTGDEQAFQ